MSHSLTHIAIVHSHFESGIVADTVCDHVESLRSRGESLTGEIGKIVLLSGNRVSGLSDPTFDRTEGIQIRGLDHDTHEPDTDEPDTDEPDTHEPSSTRQTSGRLKGFRRVDSGQASLAGRNLFERIDAAMRGAGLRPDDSIVHWHNHSLGRNAAAPFVVSHLANTGWRLLLQIHNLDADQNPENIRHLITQTGATRAATLDAIRYPVHENIAYVSPVATGQDPPRQFAIMTSYLRAIPSIVRSPPGEPAHRQAAVEDMLRVSG